MTIEFSLKMANELEKRTGIKEDRGPKNWAAIKGLRSNYLWNNDVECTTGCVMTFYNRESLDNFKKTPLFTNLPTDKLCVEEYEVLAGSERLSEMPDAQWPASQGRTPICADDLKDA